MASTSRLTDAGRKATSRRLWSLSQLLTLVTLVGLELLRALLALELKSVLDPELLDSLAVLARFVFVFVFLTFTAAAAAALACAS